MKANLAQAEPRRLAQWKTERLYDRVRAARRGAPIFVLHDGPPYANGHIHLGTVVNKVLKDLVTKKKDMSPVEFRRKCRAYAEKFVAIQRDEFERLGILGEWEDPYLTMKPEYQAAIVRQLATFVEKGLVYKAKKSVHWCISDRTALAEAEIEYDENHVSPS